jgi:hypothetical protein
MNSPKGKRPRCKQCHGYGVVREVKRTGLMALTTARVIQCPRCGGTGIEPKGEDDERFVALRDAIRNVEDMTPSSSPDGEH